MKNPVQSVVIVILVLVAVIGGIVLVERMRGGDETAPVSTAEQTAVAPAAAPANPEPTAEPAAGPTADETGINQAVVRPDGSAVIAGTAPPGAEIKLYRNGRLIGTTTADANGDWVIIPDSALPPGEHLLNIEIITPDGTSPGSRALVVEIPPGGDETPLVLLVPYGDVDIPAKVLQAPEPVLAETPTAPGAPFVRIRTVVRRDGGALHVSGKASGGEYVMIATGDASIRARVNVGLFAARDGLPFDTTAEQIIITAQLEGCSDAACTARVRLDRNAIAKALAGDSLVVIEKGDALWRIAYRTYGSGFRYVDIYRNNSEQIDDPDLIFPDQIFAVPDAE